ncbi:MAG: hypothetical protein AAFN92_06745 [Bacteroidota bacterium]
MQEEKGLGEELSIEELAAFVCDALPEERNKEVEAIVEEDEKYIDLVEGLLNIRDDHEAYQPEALLAAIRTEMAQTGNKHPIPAETTVRKMQPKRLWQLLGAAAVVLLMTVGTWLYLQDTNYSRLAQELQNESRPDITGRTMAGPSDFYSEEENYYLSIIEQKDEQELPGAILFFEDKQNETLGYPKDLALGYAYFASGDYEKAVSRFESYLAGEIPRRRRQRVEFDRALALLGADQAKEAWSALRSIANTEGHNMARRASDILDKYAKEESIDK